MDEKINFFNYKRNRDKLFANLISILDGIVCDSRVDEEEILYLDTWLMDAELISDNYCVKVIKNKIATILSDGLIEENELVQFKKDLIDIQKDMLDIPNIDFYSIESDKHLLDGLCKGIIANKKLDESEIRYLHWWLSKNSLLKNNFPGKDIYSAIQQILSDGLITPQESEDLRQLLISFTGSDINSGIVDGLSSTLPIQSITSLNFDGSNVCLTGKFLFGTRKICEQLIRDQGAIIKDDVTQNLDYLIIGTLSSKDWRFQSYGRKIEKAIEYRDEKKLPIKIISEEQWQLMS